MELVESMSSYVRLSVSMCKSLFAICVSYINTSRYYQKHVFVSHLQVEIVMLAGMLMLLLMTANTLMLYSTPASRPGMEQAVILPGIRISNWTPTSDTNIKKKTHRKNVLLF